MMVSLCERVASFLPPAYMRKTGERRTQRQVETISQIELVVVKIADVGGWTLVLQFMTINAGLAKSKVVATCVLCQTLSALLETANVGSSEQKLNSIASTRTDVRTSLPTYITLLQHREEISLSLFINSKNEYTLAEM